jgi:outer membrane lipoprotein-sorting protein
MTLKDASGNTKVRELQSKAKGSNLRLTKFVRPAEVKGVSFLVKSADEMYLYMPEFGKVRRIASHVKNENFMGTDFSYNDMGSSGYAEDYQAKVTRREGKKVHLELVPKKPQDTEYGKLSMLVDTESYLPLRIQFFDKKGTLWKEMTQERIEKVSSYWVARTITMRDLKKKHSTTMEVKDLSFDTGLGDGDFSKRQLKRSR